MEQLLIAGLDGETLDFTLDSISEFARRELPDSLLLELDERDEFPEELVRRMCGEELGVQLLFIPEEFGGKGGGAVDVYRVCERMATIDLGVATSLLATFLGSDPITVGGTDEQKQRWMTRLAEEGILMAYGATEPDAGSDLAALKTTAKPVAENGELSGYRITGAKQWISNGGVAELATVLALAPGGPSWFVVESGTEGFTHGEPEDKHGIRLSNTAALFFEDVKVGADALVGGVQREGLTQAQEVFGFTRLMVAAFGLGAGWAALDRAVPYSQERMQAGGPLAEKQGYTHKLIVPHAVRLEAARAAIEETATRIDAGEGALNTEGAIAKYLATEAGNDAADAAIQALGGNGYTHEYLVEKIKRDVRITTIYEGTSKIMEMAGIDMLPPDVGIPVVRRELTAKGEGGEVLVAGALGVLAEERHPTGGLDPEAASEKVSGPPGPMTGRIVSMPLGQGLTMLAELDPSRQAFLNDHRIDGTPVLPGVMGMEGFAEVAQALLPGWHVHALEGYMTTALPGGLDPEALDPIRAAMG